MISKIKIILPAKINLGLTIDNIPNPGEKHQLTTILAPIPLYDELEFSWQTDQELALKNDRFQIIELGPLKTALPWADNLIAQASQKLLSLAKTKNYQLEKFNYLCQIKKQIPCQAGLGGGSVDAAATLLALNQLWELNFSLAELLPLAYDLGSDVPFALLSNYQLARYCGLPHKSNLILEKNHGLKTKSQMEVLPDLPPHFMILVTSKNKISTKQAFTNLDYQLLCQKNLQKLITAIKAQNLLAIAQNLDNDFSKVLPARYGFLTEIATDLLATQPLGQVMTGSGASFIAIFSPDENKEKLIKIKNDLSKKYLGVYFYDNR